MQELWSALLLLLLLLLHVYDMLLQGGWWHQCGCTSPCSHSSYIQLWMMCGRGGGDLMILSMIETNPKTDTVAATTVATTVTAAVAGPKSNGQG